MNSSLISLGFGMWIIAIVLWICIDQEYPIPPQIPYYIFYAGVGVLVLQVIIIIWNLFLHLDNQMKKGRCIRCGKKAMPGMLYCKTHLHVIQKEAAEKQKDQYL